MSSQANTRNIGILAHVDAGKTTLTERLLFEAGAIRRLGSVDEGTTRTDSMDVERERGISVRAASTALNWKGVLIRIIDTPGHADFYAEVERALVALDGAVLVVSAVEGIQLQTQLIWSALQELNVPTLIFVNKLDRLGARPEQLIEDFRTQLSPAVIPMQMVSEASTKSPVVLDIIDNKNGRQRILETLASIDDRFLEVFVTGEAVSAVDIEAAIRSLVVEANAYPVFFGAALAGVGVTGLLDAVVRYLPPPEGGTERPVSAVVLKVETSGTGGRAAYVRMFDGHLTRGSRVQGRRVDASEKIQRMLRLEAGGAWSPCDELTAGEIGIVYGLRQVRAGDILGATEGVPRLATPTEPMLVARMTPRQESEWNALLMALRQLEEEDPLLSVEWLESRREISVRFFGEVQMEIVCDLLRRRFGVDATFTEPRVIYRETPRGVGEGHIDYRTHGYALLDIRIEPLPLGSGVQFTSEVKAEKIYHKFMKQIPEIIEECRLHGLEGWEVTDFRLTVLDGHSKYDLGTKPGDFKLITPWAFREALENAGTRLLEPIMQFSIRAPDQFSAAIQRDLSKMRATFDEPVSDGKMTTFEGAVPFSETFKNVSVLYASAHGQGILKTRFSGYAPVDKR